MGKEVQRVGGRRRRRDALCSSVEGSCEDLQWHHAGLHTQRRPGSLSACPCVCGWVCVCVVVVKSVLDVFSERRMFK